MASATGSATIDFGAAPGANEAAITITGQTSISATSKTEAWIMADDTTSDHTAADHRYVGLWLFLSCSTPTAGTGFTIYGRSGQKLQGTFQVRWIWAD